MVLLVLAVLWILVLVPPVLRARAEDRSRDHQRGADAARRELSLVGSPLAGATSPSPTADPEASAAEPDAREPATDLSRRVASLGVQRRRRGLLAHLALVVITFLAGLVKAASGSSGGWIWRIHLASQLLLVGYLLALALVGSHRRGTAAVEANVRYLPTPCRTESGESAGEPLRRSASS